MQLQEIFLCEGKDMVLAGVFKKFSVNFAFVSV